VDSPLFVLTTDLGNGSPPSAQLKAVILNLVPEARIIDLSHDIPPQSIRYAELALRSTAFLFPKDTIHIVVVDPEVGTDRRAIAVKSAGQYFIAPDNGVLGVALSRPHVEIVSLDRQDIWRHPVANTFHGRDVFAPVGAAIARGLPFADIGAVVTDPKPSGLPQPHAKDKRTIVGETLGADRFGNLLTNIPIKIGKEEIGEGWLFEIEGKTVPYRCSYMAAKIGRTIVTAGADRFIEVAVTLGSAAEAFGRAEGVEIYCMRKAQMGP